MCLATSFSTVINEPYGRAQSKTDTGYQFATLCIQKLCSVLSALSLLHVFCFFFHIAYFRYVSLMNDILCTKRGRILMSGFEFDTKEYPGNCLTFLCLNSSKNSDKFCRDKRQLTEAVSTTQRKASIKLLLRVRGGQQNRGPPQSATVICL